MVDTVSPPTTVVAHSDVAGKTAVTALASLAPLYVLLGIKNRAGLDQLHIGLLQVLFLILIRYVLQVTSIFDGVRPRQDSPIKSSSTTTTTAVVGKNGMKKATKTKKKRKAIKEQEQPAQGDYPVTLLDETLHRFLAIIDPQQGTHLPTPAPKDMPTPAISLNEWTVHLKEDTAQGVTVRQHPTQPALYAISTRLPQVSLEKLFGLLIEVSARPKWDGLTESAEQLQEIRDGQGRIASVSYMKMKGMWPVKPKDLILLSVLTRLPPTSSSSTDSSSSPSGMRIICAATSVTHPCIPDSQTGYTRIRLSVSGFIAEDDGQGGSSIIQITDFSALGSSMPQFILNTVTQKLIPASLKKLGSVAKNYTNERLESLKQSSDDQEAWIVPLIGDWQPGKDPEGERMLATSATAATTELTDDDNDDDDDDDDDDLGDEVEGVGTLTTSGARSNLRLLITQLQLVTRRLSDLESQTRSPYPNPSHSTWFRRWFTFTPPTPSPSSATQSTIQQAARSSNQQGIQNQQQGGIDHTWTIPIGVASTAVAVAATWNFIRKRQR